MGATASRREQCLISHAPEGSIHPGLNIKNNLSHPAVGSLFQFELVQRDGFDIRPLVVALGIEPFTPAFACEQFDHPINHGVQIP